MSMLAERKRRTKWVINPTKKPLWTTDSTGIKFGKELMEKMGWSAGKGLGVNEQGIQEPLKLSYKNDTKGMGFKGNDDDWIEQQDEFNELLNQLRNDNTSVKKISEEEKVVKSLEEKSKQSRARVHYQKFTRGKDLSRYSDHDLACILGTKKTIKEKSETEGVTQIKSEVIGNCETSFGVTTINSGSIQDYFKKKWITDKKSSNSSNITEDKTEISNETHQKTNSCFVKTEQSLLSEDKEEKFEKRKYKSDFEEHLNINKTKTSESEILESFEDNVKDKKKKREFQEINLEVKIKKRRKNSDDNNMLANENHLTNDFSKESKSLDNKIDSYNSVKKQKKEKTHFKLDVIEDERNCDCVAENKRKMNHEINCIPEACFSEKLDGTTVEEFNLKEEITESKKKKKSKKKEPKEINELKNEDCCCFSILPLSSQNNDVTEFGLELDSFKKKKRKEEKGEYLNKDIESKDCNCNEIENFYNHGEDQIKAASEEQLNGISRRGDALDINTVKKRKNKKEKLEKEEESINCHTGPIEEFNLEEELKEKNINADEQENVLKIQSFRKKKNKKDKAEKLYEKEKANAEFSYDQYKSVLKDTSQETNISKVISSITGQENEVEGESYQKKKKKKDNKEKERVADNINCCSNSSLEVQVQENILGKDLVKKKKKKKYKREKLDEEEKAKMEFNYSHKEKLFLEESSQEPNINNTNIASTKSELIKKKKSKKNKKEKFAENKGNESKEEFCKYSIVNEVKIPKYEKTEKLNREIVCQKMGSNNDSRTSAFHFPINDTMEGDAGVHKHKMELLKERSADKFYPGQHTNNRIRRLICWFNVAGFKGSNLNSLTGYGFLTKYGTNKFK